MAIDSSLYVCDIPAGTYNVGDTVQMKCVRGPEVVRSGYGSAILKKIVVGRLGGASDNVAFDVHLKNSNWVDEIASPAPTCQMTSFDESSSQVQNGHDCALHPNSSWYIVAKCIAGGTVTDPSSLFALLDIDYPSVANVANPALATGTPVTTELTVNASANSIGSMEAVTVASVNVDILKAGYRYLLSDVWARPVGTGFGDVAFLSISGAAGQNGLERVIPIFIKASASAALRFPITYATPLVKGPFTINLITTGSGGQCLVQLDWVKR